MGLSGPLIFVTRGSMSVWVIGGVVLNFLFVVFCCLFGMSDGGKGSSVISFRACMLDELLDPSEGHAAAF